MSTVKCYVQKPLAAGAPLQNLAAHNAPLTPKALANTRGFVLSELNHMEEGVICEASVFLC